MLRGFKTTLWRKTDHKCANHVLKKIDELAKKYELLLTKKENISHKKIPFSTNISYKLPKVHKSKQINETFQQQDKGYIETDEPDDVTVRQTKPSCKTFKQTYRYNFKTLFNPHIKLLAILREIYIFWKNTLEKTVTWQLFLHLM